MKFDDRSERNIATLAKRAQVKAREWLQRCLAEKINVKVICGTRTYAEQAELYAQGRTKPGGKVTNAEPGFSWHNFGTAWDFVVFDAKGEPQWESVQMDRCGRIAEEMGLVWGGSWQRFPDTPHIQLDPDYTLAQARNMKAAGTWSWE